MKPIKVRDRDGVRIFVTFFGTVWLALMIVSVVAIVADNDWGPAVVIWGGQVTALVVAGIYRLTGKIFVSYYD